MLYDTQGWIIKRDTASVRFCLRTLALTTQPSCCEEAQDTWRSHIKVFQSTAPPTLSVDSQPQLPDM